MDRRWFYPPKLYFFVSVYANLFPSFFYFLSYHFSHIFNFFSIYVLFIAPLIVVHNFSCRFFHLLSIEGCSLRAESLKFFNRIQPVNVFKFLIILMLIIVGREVKGNSFLYLQRQFFDHEGLLQRLRVIIVWVLF